MNTRIHYYGIFLLCLFANTLECKRKRKAKKIEVSESADRPATTKEGKKNFKDLSYDELALKKDQMQDKRLKVKYLEQMIKLSSDVALLAELTVELADILFDMGQCGEASLLYKKLLQLYPGHAQREYIYYRVVLSMFFCTFDSERDQTTTEETIRYAEQFLEQKDIFVEYSNEVRKIQQQCYARLVDSELYICEFYRTREKYAAIENRLQKVRTEYLPIVPEKEIEILSFEVELAKTMGNNELLAQKQELLDESSTGYIVASASKESQEKRFANRF